MIANDLTRYMRSKAMVWILVFVLNGDPVTSPIFYLREDMCEYGASALVEQKGISEAYCFSVPRRGARTPID